MDLWIRSQDRECLMKINRVDKFGLSIVAFVTFDNEYREIYLGRYATEERALEILDEIEDLMRSLNSSDLKIIIYEMPEE